MKGTRYKNKTIGKNDFYISVAAITIIVVIISVISCTSSEKKPVEPIVQPIVVPEPIVQPAVPESIEVSEEVYTKTFNDIEILINKLNKIIKASNFAQWRMHLNSKYINYYSDPVNLRKISSTPILKKYNITLRTLNDYFIYVVVPSRSDVRLDDISFIDDNNVKAYITIAGENVVLYTLTKHEDSWKIGL